MQILYRLYSEVPAQSAVWAGAARVRRSVPGVGAAEREPGRGGAFAGRSRAYAALDSAQVCGGPGGGVSEREECDLPGTHVWRAATEFSGGTLLGTGLLCLDGRARGRGRTPVHSGAGGGGAPVSTTGAVQ